MVWPPLIKFALRGQPRFDLSRATLYAWGRANRPTPFSGAEWNPLQERFRLIRTFVLEHLRRAPVGPECASGMSSASEPNGSGTLQNDINCWLKRHSGMSFLLVVAFLISIVVKVASNMPIMTAASPFGRVYFLCISVKLFSCLF